jgi:glycosyltransferase involved in cell wall biosynthesis
MKLSIIIPVYNVEEYLEACLDSCLHQDIPSDAYELILVNDGSEDDSLNICNRYAELYPNVHVLSQSNAGQSKARNIGLEHAAGIYIWFVDADDKIKPNSIGMIYEQCERDALEILGIGMADDDKNGIRRRYLRNEILDEISSGRDYLFHDYSSCVTSYIFKHSFLIHYKLNFLEGVFHEDEDFSLRALYFCNRIGFIKDVLYFVTIRPGSTTRSIIHKKAYDLLTVAESLAVFLEDRVAGDYKVVFYNRIALLVNSALMNATKMDDEQAMHFNVVLHKKRNLLIYLRKSSKLKYLLEGWLFMLFPAKALAIYKLLKTIQPEESNSYK